MIIDSALFLSKVQFSGITLPGSKIVTYFYSFIYPFISTYTFKYHTATTFLTVIKRTIPCYMHFDFVTFPSCVITVRFAGYRSFFICEGCTPLVTAATAAPVVEVIAGDTRVGELSAPMSLVLYILTAADD